MYSIKTWTWLACYVVCIIIVTLLYVNKTEAASIVAAAALGSAGLLITASRYKQSNASAQKKGMWQKALVFSTTLAGFGTTAAGICSITESGAWYRDFDGKTRVCLYIGLGLLFVSDTLYMIERKHAPQRENRTLRYMAAIILYFCAAIQVHYLTKISRVANFYNSITPTLRVPHNATTLCKGKSTSMNGTVNLIWPEQSANPLCVYIYWEHSRGNLLFAILFLILILVIIDKKQANGNPVLSARVASLISYAFQFCGYTSIVDNLDKPWTITGTAFGLILTHLILGALATVLRASARHRAASVAPAHVELPRNATRLNFNLRHRRLRIPVSP